MVQPVKTVIVHHPDLDVAGIFTQAFGGNAALVAPPVAAPTEAADEPEDGGADDDHVDGLPEYVKAILDDEPKFTAAQIGHALVKLRKSDDGDTTVTIAGKYQMFDGPSWRMAVAVAQDCREAMAKALLPVAE